MASSSTAEIRARHEIAAGTSGVRGRQGLATRGQALLGFESDLSYFWLQILSARLSFGILFALHLGPPALDESYSSFRRKTNGTPSRRSAIKSLRSRFY